jgi:hypothetical protein
MVEGLPMSDEEVPSSGEDERDFGGATPSTGTPGGSVPMIVID